MLGSFGHPTSNNVQQCPTMLAFVGINVGIVWPGLKKGCTFISGSGNEVETIGEK